MDLRELAVDVDREVAGAEVEIDDETTLVVARYNNTPFRKMQNRLLEPYARRGGRSKGVTEAQAERILTKCLAKHILLGWTGLKLNGEEIVYSPEKCLEVLSDPSLADFKELVMVEAQNLENYRIEDEEEDLGKSETLLDTEPAGA